MLHEMYELEARMRARREEAAQKRLAAEVRRARRERRAAEAAARARDGRERAGLPAVGAGWRRLLRWGTGA
ncbi:hypothetical protein [Streptomyces sp. MP131-18]|uniref:hypothetical protein n=1 Tax=Streptomyces sp. MP131-18 TaxID=1857892 RepID=UPI00097BC584|nr:hypothetical protein [Streptomyces sp. MP131-18]ONK10995.1 hypothetical protein STBA_17230 [Streptomyces sp. MP131-18]